MTPLPDDEIVARDEIIGVIRCLGRDVDDRERHHQRLRRNFFRQIFPAYEKTSFG